MKLMHQQLLVMHNLGLKGLNQARITHVIVDPIKEGGTEARGKDTNPMEMWNIIQLGSKLLGEILTPTTTVSKSGNHYLNNSPNKEKSHNPLAMGSVTDTHRGYKDSGETSANSEGEGFTYYITRQAKNAIKGKNKSRFKIKARSMRKPCGT